MTTTQDYKITDEEMEDLVKMPYLAQSCQIVSLITRLREAEKDAERLEFMINEQCVMQWQNGTGSPTVYSLAWPQLGETQIEWHQAPREAIDTAMQDADK